MAVLKFKAEDVRRVVNHVRAASEYREYYGEALGPKVLLVKDEGIYLMSNGDPGDVLAPATYKEPPEYATLDDRAYVMLYAHYSSGGRAKLSPSQQQVVDNICWQEQDGYGSPGFTPVQGWDWSGIRDSSPEAFSRMRPAIESVVRAPSRLFVAFAVGYGPDADYDKIRAAVGGDDFSEPLDVAPFETCLERGASEILIRITKSLIEVTYKPGKAA